ncbi:hypothetical protein YC2023_102863 [Brassica napus]
MASGAIRRLQDRVLGPSRTGIPSSTSEIWLLGVCYKISESESSQVADAFTQDFSSFVLMTYRRGFEAIGDTTYTSDVNWGCMLRSGQMLFAQALLFQRLGRSWRKKESEVSYVVLLTEYTPPEEGYLEILDHMLFVDHGKHYEDGERGGAPILCIEDVTKTCLEYSKGETEWTSVLLFVPLVLGLDKVNPRYIPSLLATFTFPQSLGILGGKPGASTYIVGVQEDKGFYLDPHDVLQVVTVNKETQDVDTSSYHCNTVRYVPLESLDPSLALGFYCRDKGTALVSNDKYGPNYPADINLLLGNTDDFDDFCIRATKLAGDSNGAPLFTVTKSHRTGDRGIAETSTVTCTCEEHEDEWQLL